MPESVKNNDKLTKSQWKQSSNYMEGCLSFPPSGLLSPLNLLHNHNCSKCRHFTFIRTLPMCLPCPMNLNADSTSSLSNTVVCSGFTVPSSMPFCTRLWTVCQSGFPAWTNEFRKMPWNELLRKNTAVPTTRIHACSLERTCIIWPIAVPVCITAVEILNLKCIGSPSWLFRFRWCHRGKWLKRPVDQNGP